MRYLVTTDHHHIPSDHQIVMVDGTVPDWTPRPQDLHWDHHRPGGAKNATAGSCGGRRTVGGSPWNTPSQLTPEEVIALLD